jgi:hypothetical protein
MVWESVSCRESNVKPEILEICVYGTNHQPNTKGVVFPLGVDAAAASNTHPIEF